MSFSCVYELKKTKKVTGWGIFLDWVWAGHGVATDEIAVDFPVDGRCAGYSSYFCAGMYTIEYHVIYSETRAGRRATTNSDKFLSLKPPLNSKHTHCGFIMTDKDHQDKVSEILRLKEDISLLLLNVRAQVAIAERYTNENQYLQDYIGSTMKSGDMK